MIARFACLLLVLAAAPALAQPYEPPISIPGGGPREPPPPPGPPPQQIFISPAGEPFRAEFDEVYPLGLWFNQADANHDGVLTLPEFSADALAFFNRLDTDKDGVVDGFENADYEREVAPEITGLMRRRELPNAVDGPPLPPPPSRGDQMGPPTILQPRGGHAPMVRRQGAAQYSLINEPHPVRGADADLDQRVSRAEAEAAARMRFGLLDKDGDGRLALADLPKTPAQRFAEPPPEGRRRKKPPKRVEMPLQPAAVNAIELARSAFVSSLETP